MKYNVIILFILSCLLFSCQNNLETKNPNVIIVITDDQGYGDIGYNGNPHLITPNLDKFASESIRFNNFHVSPVCAPTRSSLLTGRYSLRTGVTDTYNGISYNCGFAIYNRHFRYVPANTEEQYSPHAQFGAGVNIYGTNVTDPNAFRGLVDETSFHSDSWWVNSDGSGYVHYMETAELEISLNANGLEPGLYESKVVVESMTTDEKDTVDLQLTVETAIVGLDLSTIPLVFSLGQNYPNPFNPITQIRYDLPEDVMVNITIYDIMGRTIRTLVKSKQTAGYRSIQWNATNNKGKSVSAGMYFYTIHAGDFRQTKKMVLLK